MLTGGRQSWRGYKLPALRAAVGGAAQVIAAPLAKARISAAASADQPVPQTTGDPDGAADKKAKSAAEAEVDREVLDLHPPHDGLGGEELVGRAT